jgi:hypothetical protein
LTKPGKTFFPTHYRPFSHRPPPFLHCFFNRDRLAHPYKTIFFEDSLSSLHLGFSTVTQKTFRRILKKKIFFLRRLFAFGMFIQQKNFCSILAVLFYSYGFVLFWQFWSILAFLFYSGSSVLHWNLQDI